MEDKLLDVLKSLEDKRAKLSEVFGDCTFFDKEADIISDVLEEIYKIPKDNTCEMAEKYGGSLEKALEKEGDKVCCTDWFTEALFDFSIGQITKKQLRAKIKKEVKLP